jgi:probable phosphomutase (TIGR03848 family)
MLYMIRHGDTDAIGKRVTGRMAGVHLNRRGQEQASQLVDRLRDVPIARICSSPMERTLETAEPLAKARQLKIETHEALLEIDYGTWTGRSFADLHSDPIWQRYNQLRSITSVPGGESALQVQARMVGWIESLVRDHPDEHVAIFSHADPIKTVVMAYAGLHLDMFHRFDISPASVTAVRIDEHSPCILALNNIGEIPR